MLRVLILMVFAMISQTALADRPADTKTLLQQSASALEQAEQFQPERVDYGAVPTQKEQALSRKAISKIEQNPSVTPAMPKLDLLSIPSQPVDVHDLAKQGRTLMGQTQRREVRYESQVLVFVSSSMPKKTVQNYVRQTARIGAALVFRGFKNNTMKDMKQYLAEILEAEKDVARPSILIDPTLFERFQIKQVPVALATESQIQACQQMPCPVPVYHTVSGDVSLPWALRLISRQSGSEALRESLRHLAMEVESGNG